MAYRFHSLASSATPCKRRGRSCSQGAVFRKRARASTESHAAIPPVPVARRSTQGLPQGEDLFRRRGKAHSPPRRPSPSPCGPFPGAPGACSGYARRRPLGRSRPRRMKTRKGSQGKTSLQSLHRSSRDGEGGPKPIKTQKGPQGDTPCGPSRRVRRARPRHPPNANRPARGRSPCGPYQRKKKSALRERDALPSRSLALQYSRRRRA